MTLKKDSYKTWQSEKKSLTPFLVPVRRVRRFFVVRLVLIYPLFGV